MTPDDISAAVRAVLTGTLALREVRMFGGIGFMLNGNMVAAVSGRGLLLRVGRDRQTEALARPGAWPMVMRGRTMEGYVYVDPGEMSGKALQNWLKLASSFVQTLPPKTERESTRKKGERK